MNSPRSSSDATPPTYAWASTDNCQSGDHRSAVLRQCLICLQAGPRIWPKILIRVMPQAIALRRDQQIGVHVGDGYVRTMCRPKVLPIRPIFVEMASAVPIPMLSASVTYFQTEGMPHTKGIGTINIARSTSTSMTVITTERAKSLIQSL